MQALPGLFFLCLTSQTYFSEIFIDENGIQLVQYLSVCKKSLFIK